MTLRSLVRQVYYATGARRAHIGIYRKVLSSSSGMIKNQAGVVLHADPADDRAALLRRARGNLDRHAIATWRRLADELRPTVAIDVGANYGEVAFSTPMPGLRELHLVEPNPALLPWLRLTAANAQRNGFPAAVLHAGAASEAPGSAWLRVTRGYSGTSALSGTSGRDGADDEGVSVRCFRLDEVIRLTPDDTVLFKIDVEGHELAALRGMEGLLAGRRAIGVCEYIFADDELVKYLCAHFTVCLVQGGVEVPVDERGLRAAIDEGQRRGWSGRCKDVVLRTPREVARLGVAGELARDTATEPAAVGGAPAAIGGEPGAERATGRAASGGNGVVAVTVETRLQRTPDGAVWTRGGPGYPLFRRYLGTFDEVRVVARVTDLPAPSPGANRVDGPGVRVWPLPYYVGPIRYLSRSAALFRALRAATRDVEAVIVRVPSPIGAILTMMLRREGRPYAAEVLGEPYDVLAPGVVRHPLRPFLRWWSPYVLRRQCRDAAAVSYVTRNFLQSRYPAGPHALTTWYSCRDLEEDDFAATPRRPPAPGAPVRLISIGSLDQLYKGVDVLLEALTLLAAAGLTPRLTHVGNGRYRDQLERQAAHAGLTKQVTFVGSVPTEAVRQYLDAADLFVHPSRTEGLPRVVIEAMARGLPVIGTRVGGIPELLQEEQLVPANDPAALAAAIRQLLTDPDRMAAAAAGNLARAHEFHRDVQALRRIAFYRGIRYGRQLPARPADSLVPAGAAEAGNY